MKKEIPPVVAVVIILIVVIIAGAFLWRAYSGQKSTAGPEPLALQVNSIVQRVQGDVTKLTEEDKRVIREAAQKGVFIPPALREAAGAGGGAPMSFPQATQGGR